mmetsp:Transcript_4186/g.5797  ORF Transcript_4186/g.5797 Transcript_4186/m.5797 type:complete len:87 (-) Transcript_4186:207-467(-)
MEKMMMKKCLNEQIKMIGTHQHIPSKEIGSLLFQSLWRVKARIRQLKALRALEMMVLEKLTVTTQIYMDLDCQDSTKLFDRNSTLK